ncbi:MAG: hypothetical protein ACUVTB_07415 [Candidatus Bathycorpusculaceae bacterium]
MSSIRFAAFVLSISLLILLAVYVSPTFCYSREEAASKIQTAESEVLNCYRAIYEAEKAGANVSRLLEVLNEASWLLSKAKLAYNGGNYDSAFANASYCLSKLEGFVAQADSLRLEAEQARHLDFMINFVGSAFGSVAVVAVGYAVWVYLKKRTK